MMDLLTPGWRSALPATAAAPTAAQTADAAVRRRAALDRLATDPLPSPDPEGG